MKKNQVRNSLLLFIAAFIWGSAFVAQSIGMDRLGPFAFNGIRTLVGCVTLLPVIAVVGCMEKKRPDYRPATKKENRTLLIGGICCGLCLFFASSTQQIGLQYTTAGKAGFITACYILLVPIVGLFLKKKCSPLLWVAVGLALIGLYLLCINGSFSIGRGEAWCFACAAIFTCHILVVDHFSPLVSGIKLSCIQFLVSGTLGVICMLIFEPGTTFQAVLSSWKPILYAGVLSSGVAYTLQIVGQKNLNPTLASLIMSLESCISVLCGWLILGQTMSGKELAGCGLMFGAIVLAQLPIPGRKKEVTGTDPNT